MAKKTVKKQQKKTYLEQDSTNVENIKKQLEKVNDSLAEAMKFRKENNHSILRFQRIGKSVKTSLKSLREI